MSKAKSKEANIIDLAMNAMNATHRLEMFDEGTKRVGFSKKAYRFMQDRDFAVDLFETALFQLVNIGVENALNKYRMIVVEKPNSQDIKDIQGKEDKEQKEI